MKRFVTFFTKKGEVDLINVGVDVWNYKPVSVKTINKEFERLKKENEI